MIHAGGPSSLPGRGRRPPAGRASNSASWAGGRISIDRSKGVLVRRSTSVSTSISTSSHLNLDTQIVHSWTNIFWTRKYYTSTIDSSTVRHRDSPDLHTEKVLQSLH